MALPSLNPQLHPEIVQFVSQALTRLIVASFLGGLVGLERELKHRPAGLRTHLLLCFGCALITIVSADMAAAFGGDRTRIAAQIISGIGFIGAGSIMHHKAGGVQGLTTAASIFVTAGIGMAAGAGLMMPAFAATLLLLCGLWMLGVLERRVFAHPFVVVYEAEAQVLADIYATFNPSLCTKDTKLQGIDVKREDEYYKLVFTLEAMKAEQDKIADRLRTSFEQGKLRAYSTSEEE